MAGTFLVLSFLLPPLGIPLGIYGLWKDFETWRFYVFCIALGVASFAFCYIPLENTDLVSYSKFFIEMGQKSFKDAINHTSELANGGTSNLFMYNLFCWLFGRFGNYHHAAAFTTFVIYSVGMYISCSLGERMKTPSEFVVFYVLFLMISLNFYGIINNIRNVFSFSLVTLAVYRDCIEKKRNVITLVLYLIPCFFHSSAISIIVLRFFALVRGLFRYILFGFVVASKSIINYLYSNLTRFNSLGSFGNTLKYIVTKGYYYFADEASAWGLVVQQSGSRRLGSVLYISIAVIICIMYLRIQIDNRKRVPRQKNRENVFFTYSWFNFAYVLSCMTMLIYTNYWRYESNLLLSAGGIVFYTLQNRQDGLISPHSIYVKSKPTIPFYIPLMLLLAAGCMALWSRELVSYSELDYLAMGPFISCPLIVIIRQMIGL